MAGCQVLIGYGINDRNANRGVNNLHVAIGVICRGLDFRGVESYGLVGIRNVLMACHLDTITMQRIENNNSIAGNQRSIKGKGQLRGTIEVVTCNKCVCCSDALTAAIQQRFTCRLQHKISIHGVGLAGDYICAGYCILDSHRCQGLHSLLPSSSLCHGLDFRCHRTILCRNHDDLLITFHRSVLCVNIELDGSGIQLVTLGRRYLDQRIAATKRQLLRSNQLTFGIGLKCRDS